MPGAGPPAVLRQPPSVPEIVQSAPAESALYHPCWQVFAHLFPSHLPLGSHLEICDSDVKLGAKMMLAIFRALQPVGICALFAGMFIAPTASQEITRQPQATQGASKVDQDVVLRRSLMPPLLGASNLRFSPDGHYLLLQDAAGLFVISREPLRLTIYSDALDAYPAQFSSDSN